MMSEFPPFAGVARCGPGEKPQAGGGMGLASALDEPVCGHRMNRPKGHNPD